MPIPIAISKNALCAAAGDEKLYNHANQNLVHLNYLGIQYDLTRHNQLNHLFY